MSKTVKEVFSKTYVSVSESDFLSKCVDIFQKQKLAALAVVDSNGKYKGVLAERWIKRSGLDPSTTKVGALARSAPKLDPQTTLSEAARLMIESGIRQLPVFGGEKLLGFVTDDEIIHSAVLDEWGNNSVSDVMTEKPHLVEETDSVGSVLSLFRENDISHAPVMRRGQLVGIVSTIDFVERLLKPLERPRKSGFNVERYKSLGGPVKEIMSSPVVTVPPDAALKDAEQIMHKSNVHCLVVVKEDYPIGIVTKRDFLEPLVLKESKQREINVQFAAKEVQLDDRLRNYIMSDFRSFADKYQPRLGAGTLFVYMKTHGSSHKGEQLIHVRLQLRTSKAKFFSASDGWNPDQTFHTALEHLERQVLRSKECAEDSEYLHRIRFPMSDI